MKQVYYKSLFLAILSLMSVKANAYDCKVDGIYYELNESENTAFVTYKYYDSTYHSDILDDPLYIISDYSGSLTIPSYFTYDGTTYSVTGIGGSAFCGCTGLTSVEIPSSVISIEERAFYGCSGLTSVTIPNSVISIGNWAFENCNGLISVAIPNSVDKIGWGTFYGCSSLISVEIPSSVTSIEGSAFSNCSGLTSVTIPSSVTSIGKHAFGYSGLTSIEIPGSVISIGHFAFSDCEELESVIINDGVTNIGEGAFHGCSNLYTIELPNSITRIEDHTFAYCGLCSITLPDNLASIGWSAFANCSYLEEIDLPYSVDSIYHDAFENCEQLKKITIPNSEVIIESPAFSNCRLLKSVYISDIEGWCKKSFGSIFSYSSYDLYLNEELVTDIVVPNSVDSIGNGAFEGCRSLTSVILPNSVKHIGYDAFEYCSNLTSIDIPNSVTSIGRFAFRDCSGLTSVIVHWKQPILLDMSYGGPFNKLNYSDVTLYVPVGTVDTYRQTDGWNQFVNIVESSEIRISMSDDLITYYNTEEVLDFNQIGTEENVLKAYVATGFDGETVTLEEVKIVPTNTAVILMGKAKNTYTVPFYKSPKAMKDASKLPSLNESGEINYLRGVEETTTIYPTDGEKMNFVLADGDGGRRFYPVQKDGIKVYVGEAYLQLPASLCPEGISSLSLQFNDDDSSGIINLNVTNAFDNETIYNLCGQLISTPQPGVNILRMSDGSVKKVMMK